MCWKRKVKEKNPLAVTLQSDIKLKIECKCLPSEFAVDSCGGMSLSPLHMGPISNHALVCSRVRFLRSPTSCSSCSWIKSRFSVRIYSQIHKDLWMRPCVFDANQLVLFLSSLCSMYIILTLPKTYFFCSTLCYLLLSTFLCTFLVLSSSDPA